MTNVRRLKIAFTKVITWAGWNGLKINMSKVDYICFTHLYKRRIPLIPSITLPMSTNQEEMRMYKPQPHIRWLGLIFDLKLSFRQHVQHLASQGAPAAGCIISKKSLNFENSGELWRTLEFSKFKDFLLMMQMLTNTKGGLSHQNMKTLYNTCVLLTLSYTSPVWWNGKKSQIKKIESIQNRSLRMILPIFTTTPIHAMQIESGIPPLQI